jgi:hypothetical protein
LTHRNNKVKPEEKEKYEKDAVVDMPSDDRIGILGSECRL